jgi:methyl-accepting chemotaxis protein
MAAAANSAHQGVQTMAAATEELVVSIQQISDQIIQSKTAAREAVEEADGAGTTVKALIDAAQRIGQVMDLIQTVASQTNLLALNATIEAARAGEAGKGFAVVAREVKALAGETSRATTEIRSQIEAIQSTTDDVVGSIARISRTIEDLNLISTTIAGAIQQQQAVTAEIAHNAARTASSTTALSGAVATVRGASMKAGESATEVVASAEQLSQQGTRLRNEVQNFLEQVQSAA